jgi:hypothetical protein
LWEKWADRMSCTIRFVTLGQGTEATHIHVWLGAPSQQEISRLSVVHPDGVSLGKPQDPQEVSSITTMPWRLSNVPVEELQSM